MSMFLCAHVSVHMYVLCLSIYLYVSGLHTCVLCICLYLFCMYVLRVQVYASACLYICVCLYMSVSVFLSICLYVNYVLNLCGSSCG